MNENDYSKILIETKDLIMKKGELRRVLGFCLWKEEILPVAVVLSKPQIKT